MDSLLKQLDNEFKKANKNLKDLKQSTAPTEKSSTSNVTFSSTDRSTPAISFAKSNRFQQSTLTQSTSSSFSPSPCSYLLPSTLSTSKQYKFTQSSRFDQMEMDYSCYEVNYQQSSKERNVKGGCIGRAGLENEEEVETNESGVGPGGYAVNYNLVEKNVVGNVWKKEERFKEQEIKEEEEEIREINYELVKKKQPGVVIRPETEKNQLQLNKLVEEEQSKRVAANAYLQKNLMELDKGIRPNQQTAIIDTTAKRSDKERIMLLIAMIEKRRRERVLGPGQYQIVREKQQKDYKFGVVYRRMSVEIRRMYREKAPGPQSYEVNDVLIHENIKNTKFSKSERYKQQKRITLEALDLNFSINFISKNGERIVNSKAKRIKGGQFAKEKQTQGILTDNQIINEQADKQRGPQLYEPKFNLVEKRNDIGIIEEEQFGQIQTRRFRERVIEKYMVNEESGDPGGEVVSLKLTKPEHKGAYALKEPTVHQSEHVPDKLLFPEKWRFYEKDQVMIPELAGKLFKDQKEFNKNEEELTELKWLLSKWRKQPEAGSYDPEEIPSHVPQIHFDKMLSRDVIEEEPGEELLLSPEKPAKHIKVRRFSGQLGRDEHVDEKEELVIERDYQQVDPKVKGMVEMGKQLGREEGDEIEGERVDIDRNYQQVEEKVKGVEFWRMTGRDFEIKEEEEAGVIDPGPAIDKIKRNKQPGVKMDQGGERFPEKQAEQINGETTEERIYYDSIGKAVKPRPVGMQEFHKGKTKEIKQFRIKEQKKKESKVESLRSIKEEGDQSFRKYQEDSELKRLKKNEQQNINNNQKKKKKIESNTQNKKKNNQKEKIVNNSSVGPWNNPSNIQQNKQQ